MVDSVTKYRNVNLQLQLFNQRIKGGLKVGNIHREKRRISHLVKDSETEDFKFKDVNELDVIGDQFKKVNQ